MLAGCTGTGWASSRTGSEALRSPTGEGHRTSPGGGGAGWGGTSAVWLEADSGGGGDVGVRLAAHACGQQGGIKGDGRSSPSRHHPHGKYGGA
eukprot:scaffold10218_cov151-Isochrysis_galbana.AAC.2